MILFDLHNADESIHHSLMYQITSVKQVKRSEAKVSKVTDACFAVEYPLMDKPIHGAVIEISGRYPDIGGAIEFNAGDQLVIEPGEDFKEPVDRNIFVMIIWQKW